MKKLSKKISWNYSIPVFSWYIVRGMLIGFLVPVLIIGLVYFLSESKEYLVPDIYFALFFVLILFIITYLVLLVLFPMGFEYRCEIDNKGIRQISGKRVKEVNRAVIIGGVLGASASTTGSGLLAYSSEDRYIAWKEAKVIKLDEKKKYIYVSRGKIAIGPIGAFFPKEKLGIIKKHLQSFSII